LQLSYKKGLCHPKECKKRLKRRFLGFCYRLTQRRRGHLSHENGNERQQENQNGASHRQNDGHQGHDGFHDILISGVCVVLV
jgi:hypothetical protein